uniref:Reverse transcriptase Ty1/copia-type domain-containing protein n=1 Tax=Trichuris muris TaxID=70415 RepID=A0A5S6QXA7_TRIMR
MPIASPMSAKGARKKQNHAFLRKDPECKPQNPKRKRGRPRRDNRSLPEVQQPLRTHHMLLRSQNPNTADNSQSDVKEAGQPYSNSTAPKDVDQSSSAIPACNQLDVANPTSYHEAIKGNEASEWLKAMEAEMESLRDHNAWRLKELPKGTRPIKCKWFSKGKQMLLVKLYVSRHVQLQKVSHNEKE